MGLCLGNVVLEPIGRPADGAWRHAVLAARVHGERQLVALGCLVHRPEVAPAEQRLALAELGCTAAQGYHFFKPMPADKIGAVLGSLLDTARGNNVFPLRADGAS